MPDPNAELKRLNAKNFDDLNDLVAGGPFDRHLRFFNFGYRVLDGERPAGPTFAAGFPNQDSAQLLFQVLGDTIIDGKDIVELGCGRGGNLWLLERTHSPNSVTGVDIAPKSIEFARRSMEATPTATFLVGDSEDAPLESQTADVLISLETSCVYPDIEAFYREVSRLLRPSGRFVYADFVFTELSDVFVEVIEQLGFRLDSHRDITENVVASRAHRAARQRMAYGDHPEEDEAALAEYVGQEGSEVNDLLAESKRRYLSFLFTRIGDAPPPPTPLLTAEQQQKVREGAQEGVRLLTIPSVQPST